MIFSSPQYAVFLVAVFFVFWSLARLRALRTLFLLAASYYFYASWNPYYLGLIFLSSNVDFFVGLELGMEQRERRRRWLLALSAATNLGILCAFKYFNFFSDSVVSLAGWLGLSLPEAHLRVLLPVGISFYTFQSMSYTIDVYRRRLAPEQSYGRYLLFVSFFPQLVAGPIVRASHLLPQLARRPRLTNEQGSLGLLLVLVGLVKKVAIADYLAVNLVDRVFDFPERFGSLEVLAGVYGYAFQIYCDFSGYSDIAIGSALLLGLTIPKNFETPYRAASLQDFWRRWHISLSTWLRDYLYIPLGGSRHGVRRTYLALSATMLLGGLWHGAAWTFVLWGAMHGLGLAVTRAVQRARSDRPVSRLGRAVAVVATFHFVCLCWVVFRSQSITQALAVLGRIGEGLLVLGAAALGDGAAAAGDARLAATFSTGNLQAPVLAVLGLALLTHWVPAPFARRLHLTWAGLPPPVQAGAAVLVAAVLYHVASSEVVPFIYFQF